MGAVDLHHQIKNCDDEQWRVVETVKDSLSPRYGRDAYSSADSTMCFRMCMARDFLALSFWYILFLSLTLTTIILKYHLFLKLKHN